MGIILTMTIEMNGWSSQRFDCVRVCKVDCYPASGPRRQLAQTLGMKDIWLGSPGGQRSRLFHPGNLRQKDSEFRD